nr:alpha/beta hydrolase [Nannocystis pusilla]
MLVAATLHQLDVQGATVVGHSLGGTVTTALAEQSPHLVERAVIVDQAPDNSYGGLDFPAKLSTSPVIGQALWRTAPEFAIREGLSQAFAPGFDIPDTFIDDFQRMTFTSYDHSVAEQVRYTDEKPLNERLEQTGVPLLAVFGEQDQIYAAREALRAYAGVTRSQTQLIPDAGHAPNVEQPMVLAQLILAFSAPAHPGVAIHGNDSSG